MLRIAKVFLLFTEKNNSCFGYIFAHFGEKVERNYVFSLVFVFQNGPESTISMERARWDLSIGIAVEKPPLKTSENTAQSRSSFYFNLNPKMALRPDPKKE